MEKKSVIIILVVILSIIIFKIFVGHFNITLNMPYNNPIYRLQINDEYYGMNMEMDYKKNLIPKTLTFINVAEVFTYPSKITLKYGEEIKLNITGYNCYLDKKGKEKQIRCLNYEHKIMKEIKDIEFTKMTILGGSEIGITNDLVYEGKFNNDLTNIISKKGIYDIEIMLEHNAITSIVEFLIELK